MRNKDKERPKRSWTTILVSIVVAIVFALIFSFFSGASSPVQQRLRVREGGAMGFNLLR